MLINSHSPSRIINGLCSWKLAYYFHDRLVELSSCSSLVSICKITVFWHHECYYWSSFLPRSPNIFTPLLRLSFRKFVRNMVSNTTSLVQCSKRWLYIQLDLPIWANNQVSDQGCLIHERFSDENYLLIRQCGTVFHVQGKALGGHKQKLWDEGEAMSKVDTTSHKTTIHS
jgi:hypothetical protein